MRKLLLGAALAFLLAACGTPSVPAPEPEPKPPFRVTRFAPGEREAMCWEPCWDYVHVTVEVDGDTDRSEWTLATSALMRESSRELVPQLSGVCSAGRCELVFALFEWHRKYQILQARVSRTVDGVKESVMVGDWIGP